MSTSSASVRVCLAALVLSSGQCYSDAVSQLDLPARTTAAATSRQHSLATRLSAVPPFNRDSSHSHAASVPAGMKPPQRRPRGRPRRSTVASRVPLSPRTSSTATRASRSANLERQRKSSSTTSSSSRSETAATTAPTRAKIIKSSTSSSARGRSKARPTSSNLTYREMFQHDLLTKEEELALGEQVQRALVLRAAIDTLFQTKQFDEEPTEYQRKAKKAQNERDPDVLKFQQFESLEEEEPSFRYLYGRFDDEEELQHMAVYGTATSIAMEDYLFQSRDNQEEELFYQDGSPFEGRDFYPSPSTYSSIFALSKQGKELPPHQPDSQYPWLDALFRDNHNRQQQQQDLAGIHLLADEDIVQTLGIPGGRNELRSILLEGALARDKLIRYNLKLVSSIAKKWTNNAPNNPENNGSSGQKQALGGYDSKNEWRGPTFEEAVQEGVMGLTQAAERFDPSRGLRFTTFATVWVTRFVRMSFQRQTSSGMRVPPRYHTIKSKYYAAIKSHYKKRDKNPLRIDDLADQFGVSVQLLQRILQLTEPVMSIDAPHRIGAAPGGKAGSDTAQEYADVTIGSRLACEEPQPEDLVEQSLLRQRLENAMATELSPHERDILRLRMGLDDGVTRSIKEVSQVCGGSLSLSEIRNAEKRAFKKLRSPFAVHSLWQYAADFDGEDQ